MYIIYVEILSTDCQLSTEKCSKNVFSLGGCRLWFSNVVESHIGVYKECLVIPENVLDGLTSFSSSIFEKACNILIGL